MVDVRVGNIEIPCAGTRAHTPDYAAIRLVIEERIKVMRGFYGVVTIKLFRRRHWYFCELKLRCFVKASIRAYC